MKNRIQNTVGVMVSVMTCALATATAHAGGLDYQIKYVPDFDQKRGPGPGIPGLPNNGGCYCMPTSCINWVAFLTNRGYPQLGPPGNWQNADRYNLITAALDDLGADMGTDPGGPNPNDPPNNFPCGTGGDEATASLINDFNALTPGKFVVTMYYADDTYAPRYTTLVNAMLGGGLVLLRYGHYEEVVVPLLGVPAYARDGGHIMSLTGVQGYNQPGVRVRFRNPSSDESPDVLTAQSTFSTEDSGVQNVTTSFSGKMRTQTRLLDVSTNPKFIDGYIQIKPKFGLTVPDCCNNLQMNAINPILAMHGAPPMNASFTSPSGTAILDVEIHPELNRYFLITASRSSTAAKLWAIDPLTSASTQIMTLTTPSGMVFGRKGELYVRDGSALRVINPDAAVPQIGSVSMALSINGRFDYDDDADEVVGVTTANSIVKIKWTPGGTTITTKALPSGVSLPGTPVLSAGSSVPGKYWISSSQAGSAYGIAPDVTGSLVVVDQINFVPTLTSIGATSMHADTREHVLLARQVGIVEYEKVGGIWQNAAQSDFAGLPAGNHLRIAASRTNFNPATMSGPEQLDVILDTDAGTPESDCQPDIMPDPLGNRVVDIDDLVKVITTWGPCQGGNPETCPADIAPAGTGNHTVDIDDLVRVITSWGPCP